ncbi:dihydrolipoamide acetyltransferase family protein [Oricola sp.]|uniref:dihydrolipoamide acetyltransferase family protein n=1 Tax=Oricola sp. TaxID=1979950 RepID=UPI0025DAF149|nr:dihydrolipoamide acetyltransferase family protein [Oricola sp.]MCI5073897.1 2-oxo acid dehydrogenase subunit E2 [Oricola sp.]
MPSLGADMEAGTLVEWLKKPGDAVKRGDIIAVVETQKGAIEIEVFEDGVLDAYLVELGAKVPVGTALAVIRGDGDVPAAPKAATPEPVAPAKPDVETVVPEAASAPVTLPPVGAPVAPSGRLRITPAARRLVAEKGIDPATLTGTGPDGAICLADVEGAKSGVPAKPASEQPRTGGFDMGAMRDAIAAAMARSKREIPHYYLSHRSDLTAAEAFVAGRNAGKPPEDRILIAALFVKAVAKALKKYKEFNGHYENGAFRPGESVHIGMAINIRGGGLVAPAIHDAQDLDLDTVMDKTRDLVARVRAGRFRAKELSDPTITVSSLGERGVEALFGVIYPPQVAIVGIGAPVVRPWVVEGQVVPRSTVTLTLAADHRVSDGHRGGLFLSSIDKHLQEPEKL